jgi:myo-inositol-1(or 4)-monophosphatase
LSTLRERVAERRAGVTDLERGMTQYVEGFRPDTVVAIHAVERALDLARRGVGAADITAKGGRDLMTATDVSVEDAVRSIVRDTIGAVVVGEERGGEAPADGSPYWLVDPICGTRNFASGMPLYCVNLALVEGDQITVAVVGDPSTDEIHVAERGGRAWALTDGARRALTISDESRTIVIEDGKSTSARRERAARFAALAIRADRWDVRSLGTTLALSYLAAGRISAYVLFWASAIHTAAGSLLVTEAGGILSDIDGGPWTTHSDSVVASATPGLQEELLKLARIAKRTSLRPEDL